MEDFLKILYNVNWQDLNNIDAACKKVFKEIQNNKYIIIDKIKSIQNCPDLMELCEEYDFLAKISLWGNKDAPFRIRLHLFLPGYGNRAHFHRWVYSTLILNGSYKHFIYCTEKDFEEKINNNSLTPSIIKTEKTGTIYTLKDDIVHSVIARPCSKRSFGGYN